MIKTHYYHAGKNFINAIRNGKQQFCDCYLVSSLEALTNSYNGKKIISKNVRYKAEMTKAEKTLDYYNISEDLPFDVFRKEANTPIYKIVYPNVFGKQEEFDVRLIDTHEFPHLGQEPPNTALTAFKLTISKLIKKHPFKKPIICRLKTPFVYKRFEYNKPSNFMEMFTGKKPVILGENGINMTLKNKAKEARELFKQMGDTPKNNYSFVLGTGMFKKGELDKWHCFVLTSVDNKNERVYFKSKRSNNIHSMSFDEAINTFKFVVGYFNSMLK